MNDLILYKHLSFVGRDHCHIFQHVKYISLCHSRSTTLNTILHIAEVITDNLFILLFLINGNRDE